MIFFSFMHGPEYVCMYIIIYSSGVMREQGVCAACVTIYTLFYGWWLRLKCAMFSDWWCVDHVCTQTLHRTLRMTWPTFSLRCPNMAQSSRSGSHKVTHHFLLRVNPRSARCQETTLYYSQQTPLPRLNTTTAVATATVFHVMPNAVV